MWMLDGRPTRLSRRDSLREEPTSMDVLQLSLLRAASSGDAARVATLVSNRDLDVNFCTPEGWSALANAAQNGHGSIVRELLAAGAQPNPGGEASHTAICSAATSGHISVVRILLDADADPNRRSPGAMTALMGACKNGHADCVHTLLAAGADADAVDSVGRTAAALSQANAHADCLAALNDARRSERFMRVASRGNSGGSSSGGTWLTASPNDSLSRSPSSPDGSGVAFPYSWQAISLRRSQSSGGGGWLWVESPAPPPRLEYWFTSGRRPAGGSAPAHARIHQYGAAKVSADCPGCH